MTTATVLSYSCWSGVNIALRLVDGDRKPSTGFLIGGLEDAKHEIIEKLENNEMPTSLF